jgi:carbohydrate-binding DOMON domain-containing protein
MRRPPAPPVVNFPKYNTTQMRPHEPAQVFTDVSECAVRLEREARRNPALAILSWPHSTVDFDAVGRVFGGSMEERAYTVRGGGQGNR